MKSITNFIQKEDPFTSLLAQYSWSIEATALIQPLLPVSYANQFRAVMLKDQVAILFAKNGSIANTLNNKKKEILSLLAQWKVNDINIRIFPNFL